MNKAEVTIVALLVALLLAWWFFQATFFPPAKRPAQQAGAPAQAGQPGAGPATNEAALPAKPAPALAPAVAAPAEPARVHAQAERRITLSNAVICVEISSWGGGIVAAELPKKQYRASLTRDSGPLRMDFAAFPALSFVDAAGLTTNEDFEVALLSTGRAVRISRTLSESVEFVRTVSLGDSYSLTVTDVFTNRGASPAAIPALDVAAGRMESRDKASAGGTPYLGVDTKPAAGGQEVVSWTRKGTADDSLPLLQRFQPENRQKGGCSCARPALTAPLPLEVVVDHREKKSDTDWMAVKDRFFVVLLAPEKEAVGFWVRGRRTAPPAEDPRDSRTWTQDADLREVSGALRFGEKVLAPGESLARRMNCYVGPKKYALLKQLGKRQDEVMLYAWWEWYRWLCIAMLETLNGIHRVLPNYGVAILLLTGIVRVLFWPINHLSAKNMKKMQEIQPLFAELRVKYKDNPKKLQEETMALYKKHKVNPMSGCLPMLVQMPVFIALFNVLNSAVELRFAEFLWVRDLSAPENLFVETLHFPVNLLPLLMTATSVLQQRWTPSTGDPQQQRMMVFMPIVFLVVLYNMPSGLVLYWTVSQAMALPQLYRQRRAAAREKPAEGAPATRA